MTTMPVAAQSSGLGEVRFPVWGGTAVAVVTDRGGAIRAEELLRDELAAYDRVCSRFRVDSEIRELTHRAGTAVEVSPLLAQVLDAVLRAAELTDGLVDPTVGGALAELGYDRDFVELPLEGPAVTASAAPGWWRLGWQPQSRTLVLRHGIELDFGATAKALAADRAATRIAAEVGGGALVSLGGDVSVAGCPPEGGWRIAVGDDHENEGNDGGDDTAVTIVDGGLATSGTTRRRWRRGGVLCHHIVDPRTGASAPEVWRTVSVAAATCVDANTASTAAVVLGAGAPLWLAGLGLPARLVSATGQLHTICGWPGEIRMVTV
jgi:thiamine biosynthesis lipoprotein